MTLSASEWICLSATNVAVRNVLGTMEDAKRLAKWLSLCTIELLRRRDSSKYPTIQQILSGRKFAS